MRGDSGMSMRGRMADMIPKQKMVTTHCPVCNRVFTGLTSGPISHMEIPVHQCVIKGAIRA